MPELTIHQQRLLKHGYLEYRRLKTITHRRPEVSARMVAMVNALESKLTSRGRIEPESFPMRGPSAVNENIVAQVKEAKKAQQPENHERATKALKEFLEATGAGVGAKGLKEELELLSEYLVANAQIPGTVKWIPGPLKKLEKTMGKTVSDYDYAYGLNKDLVRGTLACTTQTSLAHIADLVKRTCTVEYGMHLLKKEEQSSKRDGGDSGTGYSGWNFVVQFRDHAAFGAEIQANTFDVMYGKMAVKEFCAQLRVSPDEYKEMQARMKFPGGLGHALYDISDFGRNGTTEDEGKRARKLAKDYNDACRGQFRKTTLVDLNQRILDFRSTLTSPKAWDLWKHATSECGWPALLPKVHAKVVVKPAVKI